MTDSKQKWEYFEKRCRHNFDRASRLCPRCYKEPNYLHVTATPVNPVVAVVQVSSASVGEEFAEARALRRKSRAA